MGLSQDGPIGPSQQANPQDSPPMASRHLTWATGAAPRPRNSSSTESSMTARQAPSDNKPFAQEIPGADRPVEQRMGRNQDVDAGIEITPRATPLEDFRQ